MKACLFVAERIILEVDPPRLPWAAAARAWAGASADWFEFHHNGTPVVAHGVGEGWQAPEGTSTVSLREALSLLRPEELTTALTASHLMRWRRTSRHCGVCGGGTRLNDRGRAFECRACGHSMFPKVSPAIIVQVSQGDRILLGRSHRHPRGFYSVLAGFVDPGESLEDAVRREVREESGISVTNVRYFGSQPWPFPDSLMVGFTAEYESGELANDDDEMEDVGWFSAQALPPVPPRYSIARALIDDFVARQGTDPDSIPTWRVRQPDRPPSD